MILITHFTLEEETASYRKIAFYGFIVLNPEVREWNADKSDSFGTTFVYNDSVVFLNNDSCT